MCWSGFFTEIQSTYLIGLESAEGYPLTVNDIPQAREIPKNTPYHDVFMGAMPSSRRGNASPFSVGLFPLSRQQWEGVPPRMPRIRHPKIPPLNCAAHGEESPCEKEQPRNRTPNQQTVSRLDSRLLRGGSHEKKNRRSHRKWTSRRFSHHSSAKVKLKTIFLSLTLFPILNSQAEKKRPNNR
ncbi:hypothetical protein TNCV_249511 [Trichonephila clavipes]|nr:hypothetical protein TNCV_249511 [Trichonephila clavipes]